MNKTKEKHNLVLIFLIFIFLYLTLLVGFFLNEDSAGGAIYDYNIHLRTTTFFDQLVNGLINYNNLQNSHSPIFIIFLKFLIEIFGNYYSRIIFLNLSLLAPVIFFMILKKKYPKLNYANSLILSFFFFLSPYFRSSAIWPGDENLAIIFFLLSIYYYIKLKLYSFRKSNYIYVFLNVFFLALASYFRPIYSLFSIFFFYDLILKKFNIKTFFFFILINIFLSYPAIYYVFILKINFFASYVSIKNIFNSIVLCFTVFFFYLIPFILFTKKFFNFNKYLLFISLIVSIFLIFLFNYDTPTGGGIIFRVIKFLIKDKYIMLSSLFIIFLISFYFVNKYLNSSNISNIIIIIILIFFEIDSHFYQESYDPLFLILIFFLFSSKYIDGYFSNINFKKTFILYSFLLLFYLAKIIHHII